MNTIIQNEISATNAFVPYLYFKENASNLLNAEYFKPLAEAFFKEKRIEKYELLDNKNLVPSYQLVDQKIDYFYEYVIGKLEKDSDGKIIHKFKYAFVFDKGNVWDRINNKPYKECEINGMKILYGEITLAGKPIFYYIFVELQNIIDFLKNNEVKLK